jgi:hypothetical protein
MSDEEKVLAQVLTNFNGDVAHCLLLSAFVAKVPRDKFLKAAEDAFDFVENVRRKPCPSK